MMEYCPKISVIVAVFKAENYLYRCIESLLEQTLEDFELLLINDGSPDRSGQICDEYAIRDNRIRVFHKKNGGVSSARQCGLVHAKGEYTIHIDPDDWVESTMLEIMYKKAIQDRADIVICDHYTEFNGKLKYVKQTPISLQSHQVLQDLMQRKISCVLWDKLIRLSCYKETNFKFPKGMNINEDLYAIIFLLRFSPKIAYISRAFCHHTLDKNPNMLSVTKDMQSYLLMERVSRDIVLLLDERDKSNFIISRDTSLAFSALSYQLMDKQTFYRRFGYLFKKAPNSQRGVCVKIALKSYRLGIVIVPLLIKIYHIFHYKK